MLMMVVIMVVVIVVVRHGKCPGNRFRISVVRPGPQCHLSPGRLCGHRRGKVHQQPPRNLANRRWLTMRMSRHGLIHIPPTDLDVALADAAAGMAQPSLERTMRVLTWLADEKVLLAGAALSWAYVRAATEDREMHCAADEMLCAVAIASAVPHLCKRVFARERPDRTIVRRRGRGIPKSGNAWDSFPSGHAVHVGALAPAVAQIVPARVRSLVWPAAAALAATRLLLLAHYLSDVLAGLALGIVINRSVAHLLGRART